MTPEELGKALTQARIARGLTLHDAERDTRINGKYLEALEEGELDTLPAPVYARAFMRTYAQYLGMNAPTLVQHLPGAKREPELPPLPEVGRAATAPLVSASWLVAGAVVIILLGVGLVLFWSRGSDTETVISDRPNTEETIGLGAEQSVPPAGSPKPPPLVEPGVVPDVEGHNAFAAAAALGSADVLFLIVEVSSEDDAAGIVFDQTPAPGTAVEENTVVTLMVSRGGS